MGLVSKLVYKLDNLNKIITRNLVNLFKDL